MIQLGRLFYLHLVMIKILIKSYLSVMGKYLKAHWLGRKLEVDAIDQDAAYFASACSEMSIPFAIIRGITSEESSNFSQSRYLAGHSTRSTKSKMPITPVSIFEHIKFRLGVRVASNRMDQVLTRINSLSLRA